MTYLLDTNVLSELQKRIPDPSVVRWFEIVPPEAMYVSVMVVGEIRLGVENLRVRDPARSGRLEDWLESLKMSFGERILPVTAVVAETWGRLRAPRPLGEVDSLLAATALVYGLTVVSRDTSTAEQSGVPFLNPWDGT